MKTTVVVLLALSLAACGSSPEQAKVARPAGQAPPANEEPDAGTVQPTPDAAVRHDAALAGRDGARAQDASPDGARVAQDAAAPPDGRWAQDAAAGALRAGEACTAAGCEPGLSCLPFGAAGMRCLRPCPTGDDAVCQEGGAVPSGRCMAHGPDDPARVCTIPCRLGDACSDGLACTLTPAVVGLTSSPAFACLPGGDLREGAVCEAPDLRWSCRVGLACTLADNMGHFCRSACDAAHQCAASFQCVHITSLSNAAGYCEPQ